MAHRRTSGTALEFLPGVGAPKWRAALAEQLDRAPSREHALAGLRRLADAGGEQALAAWPIERLESLIVVLGSSTALTRQLVSAGPAWTQLAERWSRKNPTAEELVELAAVPEEADPDTLASALRRMARLEMSRIGARDLTGEASLDETLEAITRLADVSVALAVEHVRRFLAGKLGEAVGEDGRPIGFVVLALGKHGGMELNYSSDIDVLYLYDHDQAASGSPQPREFFARLAAEVTRVLSKPTDEGIVFRVDLRLRPEGDGGPLINSVANALTYYEGWGDTWERGVLIKARPVAGDHEVGERFIDGVRPFVYRRHLDYQTIEDFRHMKQRIDAEEVVRARRGRDVKLGRGGIRELEFVVQVLQLIHGGHDPAVRVVGTRAALEALENAGFLSAAEARALDAAYRFLRNVEHAIQIVEQRQSQRLPDDEEGLRWLARRLGYGCGRRGMPAGGDEVAAFEADFERHTGAVRAAFVKFLELRAETSAPIATEDADAVAVLGMLERGDIEEAAAVLEEMGFPDGARAAERLLRLYRGRIAAPASPQRRRAVESMAPALLRATASSADPDSALDRMVDFLTRTGAHTSYLALLSGSPATMRILLSLFATSPYLAAHLVGHPEIIDSLVRSDQLPVGGDRQAIGAELERELQAAGDEEEVLAVLRRFRTTELIRIGMADLGGVLSLEQVHEALTALADACLSCAVAQARRELEKGTEAKDTPDLEFCVIGLGKMGAGEMTYGSDLDLMFVYRSNADGFDAAAHGFATRWAQKTMNLLQARTRDGIVYKIDARLRPSGRSGPLVTSLARFCAYHKREAELWERQAHTRARVVVGPPDLAETVERTIAEFVYGRGLDAAGVREIDELRRRVERELANEGPATVNIKTGRGGIVDIEFVAQMLLLRYGHEHPEVRRRSTIAALQALRDAGLLERGRAATLLAHYRFLRRLEARMRLERDRPVEELGTDPRVLAPLARRLGFTGEDPGGALLERCRQVREEVRALYESIFAAAVDV
ncbi:MAG: bifunctional [glutamate--ammonia ligase]-adenylyl-L-tyrosine phosphorylase/[glutamate--ammonia-ligase] adenylyltransferase [Deltaproteobacteria bacterium]|nr:MAG: bifunctional [glutamate--ammonia ligase]-adenylyl-L-tyrosine phosphorylase/[glutamate--ammonia-ligase] adenylyltransferase [Deltaproteobacteria bacterium]